ncbi:LOW QUALITY PROTEIN: hephaestin-like protein [Pecten maximus]|uniref:LOW QUALITY PROTEIN: hephaestin-like protein n=1 Tax=Pecten maximus TaxID=6579 RepID=UPI00145846AF|nr:LOW QUALITY PROTEIN: hephaestin-like protein [Pecten maximus]
MLRLLLLLALIGLTLCRNVEYFIQAEEIDWDYAPTGQDIINEDQSNARYYLERKVYRKVVYREYLDASYANKAPRSDHLGILGPTLKAGYGDFLIVHFRNSASHPHSIHPTRLSYTKENEGSQYGESPEGRDDAVSPGHTFTYHWNVTALSMSSPDVTCVSGLYYSDTDRVRDVNSGLVGFLIVCKPDGMSETEDKNVNMLLQSFNENLSLYRAPGEPQPDSNIMHTVNGFVFGNLPSPHVCTGDDVTMHFGSLGSTSEPHTVRIHGHSFVYMGKRQPSLPIVSGLTVDAQFRGIETGSWLMSSQNPKLMKSGMQGIVLIEDCGYPPIDFKVNGVIRKYYIAIDNVVIPGRSGPTVGFVPYVDSRFTTRVMRTRSEDYLGVLGPLLEAEIGDIIKIVVKNNDTRPHSLQPHGGVRIHKYNEGTFYNDSIDTSPIQPGYVKTYFWMVSEMTGPTAYNLPCMPSFYTSGVDLINEIHTGLIGPMLICNSGLLENKIPSTRDLFLFYIRSNTKGSNDIHGLNGFPPNAFPRIEMPHGDASVLHVMNIGSDDTASSLFIDGLPFSLDGASIFTLGLHHGLIRSFRINGRKEGQEITNTAGNEFSFNFRIGSGLEERDPLPTNISETFYIALQNEFFDYTDRWISEYDWRSVQDGEYQTGPEFKKAMFKCYMRNFFWFCIKKSKGQRPPIRVVAGTSIRIVFQNNSTRNYSMYSPGVVIRRSDGGTRLVVHPWEQVEFLWTIPESIGPGSGDQDCVMRKYYSNVNPERDIATGLIGPLIICRDHAALASDEAVSVPLFVGVVNEVKSWYIDQNIPNEHMSINRSDPSFIRNNRITVVDYRAAISEPLREGYVNQNIGFYLHNVGDTFHSIHFHGCMITASSDAELIGQNVVPLFPEETKHVVFTCRGIGSWKFEGLRYQDTTLNHKLVGLMDINPEPNSGIS